MKPFYLAISLLLTSLSSLAVEYQGLLADASKLTFGYRQMGVPMDGDFSRFTAQIAFDPAQPATASARFEVDLKSIDVGYSDGNDEILKADWLDVSQYPTAHFISREITPLDNNTFAIKGELNIKGKTLAVTAPLTITKKGNTQIFSGSLALKRLDFAIGEGLWADLSVVANEITIHFLLVTESKH
ncbi:MAG: polyisoprenoid-binding protein [Cellvibrionales bacterium]|nr:MAG: polyisoprenoid-binding protein [Cellvibrionales bacterium]